MTAGAPTKPVRVMLVEDHASFRQALALILDLEPDFSVVSQAGSLAEARDTAVEGVDFAIVDLALPDGEGSSLIGDLRRSNPGVAVLILSATLEESNLARAVEAGASGILDKLAGLDEIVETLRRLKMGEALPRQQEVVELLRHAGRGREPGKEARPAAELSPPEEEMLRALADGLGSEKIANRLGITTEEEQAQMMSILDKLGAYSRLQALLLAARRGIVEIP